MEDVVLDMHSIYKAARHQEQAYIAIDGDNIPEAELSSKIQDYTSKNDYIPPTVCRTAP